MQDLFGPLPWTASPTMWLVAISFTVLVLYLGRSAGHGAILGLSQAFHEGFKRAAWLTRAARDRLVERNREVLLEMGRQATEQQIEREFQRVGTVVAKDLSGYPALNRKLSEQLAAIDDDYREAAEVAPTPPEWTRAVESIAAIPAPNDPVVGQILEDIHESLVNEQKKALREYRAASAKRHRLLHRMLPMWRRLSSTLECVDGQISGLTERAAAIDRHMAKYEKIRRSPEEASRALSASSMNQFIASALVLTIATLGALVNFQLIALPMSEMVGGNSYIGPFKTSDIAGFVLILTEMAMGLFLMESLRITKLFPVIHNMDDRMRRRMIWISLGLLLTLAGIEASLAYMRDLIAADRELLSQQLAGSAAVAAETSLRWIPSLGQMVLGFILPFVLAFAAIPIETFIPSSRVVGGNLVAGILRLLASGFELLGAGASAVGGLLVHVYDFVIVIPLRLEQAVARRIRGERELVETVRG